MTEFEGIEACVFDAYGTLFDVHSAVAKHQKRLGDDAPAISATWRTKQLEYTWLRSLMRRYDNFRSVTGDALDYALDTFGIDDDALRNDLLSAYMELDPYPEVSTVLGALKANGYKTAVLSNGSPDMLEAAVGSAGVDALLDATLSVDEIGIYKPDPRVYQMAVDRLGVAPAHISFQSSNAWDAVGAATFGFKVAWVNRFGQRRERLTADPHAEIADLSALLPLLGIPET